MIGGWTFGSCSTRCSTWRWWATTGGADGPPRVRRAVPRASPAAGRGGRRVGDRRERPHQRVASRAEEGAAVEPDLASRLDAGRRRQRQDVYSAGAAIAGRDLAHRGRRALGGAHHGGLRPAHRQRRMEPRSVRAVAHRHDFHATCTRRVKGGGRGHEPADTWTGIARCAVTCAEPTLLETEHYPDGHAVEPSPTHLWATEFLHMHHTGEDVGLWPLIRSRNPSAGALLDRMDADHKRIGTAVLAVQEAARAHRGDEAAREQLSRHRVRTLDIDPQLRAVKRSYHGTRARTDPAPRPRRTPESPCLLPEVHPRTEDAHGVDRPAAGGPGVPALTHPARPPPPSCPRASPSRTFPPPHRDDSAASFTAHPWCSGLTRRSPAGRDVPRAHITRGSAHPRRTARRACRFRRSGPPRARRSGRHRGRWTGGATAIRRCLTLDGRRRDPRRPTCHQKLGSQAPRSRSCAGSPRATDCVLRLTQAMPILGGLTATVPAAIPKGTSPCGPTNPRRDGHDRGRPPDEGLAGPGCPGVAYR